VLSTSSQTVLRSSAGASITGRQEALERMAALYTIKSEIRARPPDARRGVRQARARPLLESFEAWLESCLAKMSRKSETTAAVKSALSLGPALTRYVDDGRCARSPWPGGIISSRNRMWAGSVRQRSTV
jgi:transposase